MYICLNNFIGVLLTIVTLQKSELIDGQHIRAVVLTFPFNKIFLKLNSGPHLRL